MKLKDAKIGQRVRFITDGIEGTIDMFGTWQECRDEHGFDMVTCVKTGTWGRPTNRNVRGAVVIGTDDRPYFVSGRSIEPVTNNTPTPAPVPTPTSGITSRDRVVIDQLQKQIKRIKTTAHELADNIDSPDAARCLRKLAREMSTPLGFAIDAGNIAAQ